MRAGLRSVLVFAGVFLALTLLAGSLGLLGSWELLLIAAVAAGLTALAARTRHARQPGNGSAP